MNHTINYPKLIRTLSQQNLNVYSTNNFSFNTSKYSSDIFDVLIWNLNLKSLKFKQISSGFDYNAISTCNFESFLLAIKPCFQNYFVSFFTCYFNTIINNKTNDCKEECRLQSLLPIKLKKDKYYYVNLCVDPVFKDGVVVNLFFIITPLKEYLNEVINFNIFNNRVKNEELTYQINNQVYPIIERVLTGTQSEIFNFLLLGFSSSKIAKILNKKKENIFKYYIRITKRLSSFFNIEFDNVKEATNYYRTCFLLR